MVVDKENVVRAREVQTHASGTQREQHHARPTSRGVELVHGILQCGPITSLIQANFLFWKMCIFLSRAHSLSCLFFNYSCVMLEVLYINICVYVHVYVYIYYYFSLFFYYYFYYYFFSFFVYIYLFIFPRFQIISFISLSCVQDGKRTQCDGLNPIVLRLGSVYSQLRSRPFELDYLDMSTRTCAHKPLFFSLHLPSIHSFLFRIPKASIIAITQEEQSKAKRNTTRYHNQKHKKAHHKQKANTFSIDCNGGLGTH